MAASMRTLEGKRRGLARVKGFIATRDIFQERIGLFRWMESRTHRSRIRFHKPGSCMIRGAWPRWEGEKCGLSNLDILIKRNLDLDTGVELISHNFLLTV